MARDSDPRSDTFITAADCGSFSKAAEVLYIPPAAVILERLCAMPCAAIFGRTVCRYKLEGAPAYMQAYEMGKAV